jgi:hypothetical protein
MTAPPPKANLPYPGLDCSEVSLAMKRHLGVGMSHQPHHTLACLDLLAEYSGLAMRGVGGVHRERSEQKSKIALTSRFTRLTKLSSVTYLLTPTTPPPAEREDLSATRGRYCTICTRLSIPGAIKREK